MWSKRLHSASDTDHLRYEKVSLSRIQPTTVGVSRSAALVEVGRRRIVSRTTAAVEVGRIDVEVSRSAVLVKYGRSTVVVEKRCCIFDVGIKFDNRRSGFTRSSNQRSYWIVVWDWRHSFTHRLRIKSHRLPIRPRIVLVPPHSFYVRPRIVLVPPHSFYVRPRIVLVLPHSFYVLPRISMNGCKSS